MTVHICPRCNRTFIANDDCDDFEHECNSGVETLDNEDVVKTGNWEDFTGSGIVNNSNLQGTENQVFGTRAQIEGEDVEDETSRGNRISTHRTRQHIEHITLEKVK